MSKKGRPMRATGASLLIISACFVIGRRADAQQSYAPPAAVPGSVSRPVYSSGLLNSSLGGSVTVQPLVGQPSVLGMPTSGTGLGSDMLTSAPAGSSVPIVTSFPTQGEVLPYSYWVAAPNPARVYVEYGSVDQFPFHGRPYGSPSDRWSWYGMSGGSSRFLARYYYPPLR